MKFESEKRAHLWAKLQTLATHVKHRAVRTAYHTTEKENIPCWTVVIERSARERKKGPFYVAPPATPNAKVTP